MKSIIALSSLVLLTGCVNLYAGISQYEIKPFKDETGTEICCMVNVISGKNEGAVTAHIQKNGDTFVIDLKESQINSAASITAATSSVSDVAKAVDDTAITVQQITKKVP